MRRDGRDSRKQALPFLHIQHRGKGEWDRWDRPPRRKHLNEPAASINEVLAARLPVRATALRINSRRVIFPPWYCRISSLIFSAIFVPS